MFEHDPIDTKFIKAQEDGDKIGLYLSQREVLVQQYKVGKSAILNQMQYHF